MRQAQLQLVNKKPLATYLSEIEECKRDLEAAKTEGKRWADIKEKFAAVKAESSKIDVSSLSTNFIMYMQKLTDNSISVEDFNDRLSIKMNSGSNQLIESILSYGTRETIELAFRLAMLDELYPRGGGFAVFDDAFVNMDPDRTDRACDLIKEFSKKNQVIFVTCHPEIAKALGVKDEAIIKMP